MLHGSVGGAPLKPPSMIFAKGVIYETTFL
jgi:hypothetical protein